MTVDVSAFGIRVRIIASQTFPMGVDITAFADDADPVDMSSIQLRDKAAGVNGDLIVWSKANPVPLTLSVLPNTPDDDNLQILAKANRAAKGRRAVQDEITAIITYPDGRQPLRMLRGAITDGIIGNPVASSGRLKTKPYIFNFEDVQ